MLTFKAIHEKFHSNKMQLEKVIIKKSCKLQIVLQNLLDYKMFFAYGE